MVHFVELSLFGVRVVFMHKISTLQTLYPIQLTLKTNRNPNWAFDISLFVYLLSKPKLRTSIFRRYIITRKDRLQDNVSYIVLNY